MIISKNVVYSDPQNTIETDVVEINLDTRDINFLCMIKKRKLT